ncbi:MAG: homocitrate synthase [Candidatus Heimdallarchaeota archaeon]|nr:homocitrate synthase [Candidatus Heimdallarchaeota archaeon]
MPKNIIKFLDVTNRDGVQTSRLGLSKIQKTMLNIMLNKAGVYQSEFGFPTTRHETHYLNANVELAKLGVISPMILEGWIRAIKEDVLITVETTDVEHLNLSISTSEQMTQGKFQGRVTRDQVIDMMVEATKTAKEKGIKTIGVNAEDSSRTDMEFLLRFAQAAKEAGAMRIRYCDTLGYESPKRIRARCRKIAEEIKLPVELHCHNDLGMAVANSIEGALGVIDGGQDAYINTTVNGMGERAGNADLVSCILGVKYAANIAEEELLDPNIKLNQTWRLAQYASYAFDVPIPINQPGVGANAFAHESGIHADGALKDRKNYELYDYEILGRGEPEIVETGRSITTGEYSGIKGFLHVAGKYDVEFKNDEDARYKLDLTRFANVDTQKPLTEEEVLFICNYPEIARKILTKTP